MRTNYKHLDKFFPRNWIARWLKDNRRRVCFTRISQKEKRDPSAETVVQIATALKTINPDAAAEFISLYVGDFLHHEDEGQNLP